VQAVLQERTEKGKQQDARATAGATDKESGSWRAGKAMEIIACKGKGEKTKGTRRRRSNKNWFEQEGRKKIDDSHRVRREDRGHWTPSQSHAAASLVPAH
jgi:hypothetical protein